MKTLYTFGLLLLTAGLFAQPLNSTNEIKTVTDNEEVVRLIPAPVRFYYYPNMDAYFDAEENVHIFQQNGQWVKAKEIPSGYRGYSLYNGMRVELAEYNGEKPYELIKDHQKQFPKKYTSRRQAPKIDKKSNVALN